MASYLVPVRNVRCRIASAKAGSMIFIFEVKFRHHGSRENDMPGQRQVKFYIF
jgi:hypothetical protein